MAAPDTSAPHETHLVTAEPAPDAVVAAAKAAFRRAVPRGTLARLAFDSDQDLLDAVGPRRLRFEHARLSLDVHVAEDGDRRAVSAFSDPSGPLTVERYCEPPEAPVALDGGTAFPASPGDLLRVRATVTGGRPGTLQTEWFRV